MMAGKVPPGTDMVALEAGLRARTATSVHRLAQALDWPLRPGEVTALTAETGENDQGFTVTTSWTNPTPAADRTRIEIERPPGTVVEKRTLTNQVYVWAGNASHTISEGTYIIWVAAENCIGDRCVNGSWTTLIHEVEAEAEPPEETPPTGRLEASNRSWSCEGTCQLTTRVTLAGITNEALHIERVVRNEETREEQVTPINAVGTVADLTIPQGRWSMRARYRKTDGTVFSEWTNRLHIDATPTASEAQGGDAPGQPRNVRVEAIEPDVLRVRWNEPSSIGGWRIDGYEMGDLDPPGSSPLTCPDSRWPARTVQLPTGTGERPTSFDIQLAMADDIPRFGIRARNARGYGPCTIARVEVRYERPLPMASAVAPTTRSWDCSSGMCWLTVAIRVTTGFRGNKEVRITSEPGGDVAADEERSGDWTPGWERDVLVRHKFLPGRYRLFTEYRHDNRTAPQRNDAFDAQPRSSERPDLRGRHLTAPRSASAVWNEARQAWMLGWDSPQRKELPITKYVYGVDLTAYGANDTNERCVFDATHELVVEAPYLLGRRTYRRQRLEAAANTQKIGIAAIDFVGQGGCTRIETGAPLDAAEPFTAEFIHPVPQSHGGNEFRVQLGFSREATISYVTLRDHAFRVNGGSVIGAARVAPPRNRYWWITFEPDGTGTVAATLVGNRPCSEQRALCTDDNNRLANSPTLQVEH